MPVNQIIIYASVHSKIKVRPILTGWKIMSDFNERKRNVLNVSLAILIGVSMWASVSTVSADDDCNRKTYWSCSAPAPADVQAVDLGLPSGIKWASCNLGAEKPEDFGNYYAWGEVVSKEEYMPENHKYIIAISYYGDDIFGRYKEYKYTKYCKTIDSYRDDESADKKTTLELEDDAAHFNWGGNWRIPTIVEIWELLSHCTWKATVQNGVGGFLVMSRVNTNSIFLPYAGYRQEDQGYGGCAEGHYWSSSVYEGVSPGCAWQLELEPRLLRRWDKSRECGLSIRPVCP